MSRVNRPGPCFVHGTTEPIYARGLCHRAYKAAQKRGKLEDFPKHRRTYAQVIADCERLRAQGLLWREVAARLGYKSAIAAAHTYRDALRALTPP